MSLSLIMRTEMFEMPAISSQLYHSLEHFTRQHYRLSDSKLFNAQVIDSSKAGDLAVFYDFNNKIIAFTRIFRQTLTPKDKAVTVYFGNTYYDPRINPSAAAAKFGLTKAMKYQLAHPQEKLVYFANATSPARYQFIASLINIIYPKKDLFAPDDVLQLLSKLKEQNRWLSHPSHPMVIGGQLVRQHAYDLACDANEPLQQYYLSLNPDYLAGNSLLVYIPLNLTNISRGIKHIVSCVADF